MTDQACALELAARHGVRHVGQQEAVAGVGAVGAVAQHRVCVRHAGQRQPQLHALDLWQTGFRF